MTIFNFSFIRCSVGWNTFTLLISFIVIWNHLIFYWILTVIWKWDWVLELRIDLWLQFGTRRKYRINRVRTNTVVSCSRGDVIFTALLKSCGFVECWLHSGGVVESKRVVSGNKLSESDQTVLRLIGCSRWTRFRFHYECEGTEVYQGIESDTTRLPWSVSECESLVFGLVASLAND